MSPVPSRRWLRPDGDIRQGFVYERVPHITLRDIANNAEIDVIWERYQEQLEPSREMLNDELDESWEEWEIPREADPNWPDFAKECHARLVEAAHRPAARDRRLDRGQGRVRIPLRQALRGPQHGPCGWARSPSRACRLTACSASTRTTN